LSVGWNQVASEFAALILVVVLVLVVVVVVVIGR
jgi:hypothetical protein